MSTQNITLALPKHVLRRVKVIAAQRGTSVSRLLVETLQQVAARDEAYERARERAREVLKHPPDLGTRGRANWSRDELHER
jgi:esterase/lipase superfamily enzyme